MNISDFNYKLSDDMIALNPPQVRGTSRLLVLGRDSGKIADRHYANIVDYLRSGDVLVLNDTKVIKARLMVQKMNGSRREIIILEKHSGHDDWYRHKVMYRGKLNVGDELIIDNVKLLVNEILGDGLATIESKTNLLELAKKYGLPPLPPYIKRDTTSDDVERYQTVFADKLGSVAAPTASLNMTSDILDSVVKKGVIIKHVTLHVGLGTFMPIRSDTIEDHKMHSEYFEIPPDTLEAIKNAKRVVTVGTTVARTLEYALPKGIAKGEADIFIYPGYEFKIIDGLVTNFHAPRSTVLMLAAAFAGWSSLKAAYEYAKNNEYKFLSYGDSMLIF